MTKTKWFQAQCNELSDQDVETFMAVSANKTAFLCYKQYSVVFKLGPDISTSNVGTIFSEDVQFFVTNWKPNEHLHRRWPQSWGHWDRMPLKDNNSQLRPKHLDQLINICSTQVSLSQLLGKTILLIIWLFLPKLLWHEMY